MILFVKRLKISNLMQFCKWFLMNIVYIIVFFARPTTKWNTHYKQSILWTTGQSLLKIINELLIKIKEKNWLTFLLEMFNAKINLHNVLCSCSSPHVAQNQSEFILPSSVINFVTAKPDRFLFHNLYGQSTFRFFPIHS